jgi:DNA polymerase
MATRSKKARQSGELPLLSHNLKQLSEEAQNCRNCDLWRNATQTVFGEGSPNARIMLIGEVPGDQEDLQGHPFVGPAGKFCAQNWKKLGSR